MSLLAAIVFLGLNGLDFVATDEEVVEKSVALAGGEFGEAESAEWIRSRSLPTD